MKYGDVNFREFIRNFLPQILKSLPVWARTLLGIGTANKCINSRVNIFMICDIFKSLLEFDKTPFAHFEKSFSMHTGSNSIIMSCNL